MSTCSFVRAAALAACMLGLAGVPAAAGDAGSSTSEAARLVQASGAPGGLVAVVGAADADLALAIARQGPFTVHCLARTQEACDALREVIRAAGVYGTVSADVMPPGGRLPYADHLVNLVVAEASPGARGVGGAEVVRVLAPLGTVCIDCAGEDPAADVKACHEAGLEDVSAIRVGSGTWVVARKPWPKDIDEWTHYLHGPDGNPVARDTVVGPPRRYQWLAEPTWMQSHETDSSVSTLVTARGRLFAIVNEAPTSLPGPHSPPDKWFLVARDAFNGILLWKVPIPHWGWREWKKSWFTARPGDIPLNIQKRLVAVGDKVYVTLGYRAPVSELDARTGAILKTYAGTERTSEILLAGGTLVLSTVTDDRNGVRILAVDAATGRRLWQSRKVYRGTTVDYIRWKAMHGATEPSPLDPAANIATDGVASVALIDGPNIVCLDYKTGRERWNQPFPSDPADEKAGGMNARGNLWNGTVIVADGVVLHASPNRLAALDANTGTVLWKRPKAYIGHLWYEWKEIFLIDGVVWTWGEDLKTEKLARASGRNRSSRFPQHVNGYDLKTGEVVKSVDLGPTFKANHHHRCYRDKATVRYILASRRGSEYIDLSGGPHTIDNWVRGTCHVGMMPANGLQYVPPHPCVCYIEEKINGMQALAPAAPPEEVQPAAPPTDPSRLERGPAYGADATAASVPNEQDWPEFRHDAARTGAVATRVPDGLEQAWRVTVGRRVSPPVAVGDRVFLALVDEHQVVCLSATDGREVWRFTSRACGRRGAGVAVPRGSARPPYRRVRASRVGLAGARQRLGRGR